MSTNRFASVTRRRFLKETGLTLAAAGAAPMLSAPFVSKALAQNKSLSIVQWAHFVPEYDTWFDKFAKDWGEKNKVSVTVDHVPVQNIPARAAAEASAGSGHDLFGFNGAGGAHLYRKFFIDVADLVKETEKKYGKVSVIGKQLGYNADDGTWSAFPDFYINFPGMYQKSLWDEIGMKPDTWDNLRIGGAKLKAKGHPVGISLGHSNDPSTTWRGLLWSYGGGRPGRGRQEDRPQQQGGGRGDQVRCRALQGSDDTATCCPGTTPATTSTSPPASARTSSTRSPLTGRRRSRTRSWPTISPSSSRRRAR